MAKKAKKAAKKAKKAKKVDVGSLIVASKVKAYVRAKDVNCGSDVLEALNTALCDLLDKAVERALANKRKTLRAQDL